MVCKSFIYFVLHQVFIIKVEVFAPAGVSAIVDLPCRHSLISDSVV